MIHTAYRSEDGFTAVELLITLFIGAIFLFAGYQLYTHVIQAGAYADKATQVSNYAYETLRKEAGKKSGDNTCDDTGNINLPVPSIPGVSNVLPTLNIDCPFLPDMNTILVTISVSYHDGESTKVIKHATYAN